MNIILASDLVDIMKDLADKLAKKQISMKTQVFTLNQIEDAYRVLESNSMDKVVIQISQT